MKKINILFILFVALALGSGCGSTKDKNADRDVSGADQLSDNVAAENSNSNTQAGSGVLRNDPEIARSYSADVVLEGALSGNKELVAQALAAGFNVNGTDKDGHTALMLAAYNGHSEIIRLLLNKGAKPDQRDALDRTALMYASTGPFNNSVKMLLDAGANPNLVDNEEHFTPLMFAAAEGQKEVAKTLLEHGADRTKVDVDGESAYDFAMSNGHTEVAELIRP